MRTFGANLGAAVVMVLGAAVAHAGPNLLVNGSFEDGTFIGDAFNTMSVPVGSTAITGWSVITDTTAWIGTPNPWSLLPSDGSRFLDLTNYQPGSPFAGVSQTIATQVGATYTLSFDLGGSTRWGLPDGLTASAGAVSQEFSTPGTGTVNDWYHHTLEFVATSTLTTITLQGTGGVHYIGVDNVSVELATAAPIPEPQASALLAAGLAALAALGRRRRA